MSFTTKKPHGTEEYTYFSEGAEAEYSLGHKGKPNLRNIKRAVDYVKKRNLHNSEVAENILALLPIEQQDSYRLDLIQDYQKLIDKQISSLSDPDLKRQYSGDRTKVRRLEPEMEKELEVQSIRNNHQYLQVLKLFNIPTFILEKIASDCNSNLIKKGRFEDYLRSMNDSALELMHRVFVDCEDDPEGTYADYRFLAYIASMYHRCEFLLNEKITGASGEIHEVPLAVKNNGMYIGIATNKSTGEPVSKKEVIKFYKMVDDIKKSEHGTMLSDGIFCSSVGFDGKAVVALEKLNKSRKKDLHDFLDFKTANFKNRVYSVLKSSDPVLFTKKN